MKKIILLIVVVLALGGCATTSRLVHLKAQPPVASLFPNEEDIAKVIEEIKAKPATSTGAVKWNQKTGKYEVTPEAWEKVLNDKIYLMALKKKIEAFAEKYDPETLGDAWRKDLGTSVITILLMLGIMVY
ncbi:MAG: hypothetical protein JW984_15320 [Deltaproteobacteria bacterium]|uniref:Lipoprotein n=1 Tax=Candidatus Zymogenus saltonus TaxID=2844893 RepID=A0A9D8KGY3_9DELT|nr:hypothetical protein [Candidatus Zymogenus saltonus]